MKDKKHAVQLSDYLNLSRRRYFTIPVLFIKEKEKETTVKRY